MPTTSNDTATASTATLSPFDAGHDDLIHDIKYDYYGKRLIVSDEIDAPIRRDDRSN